MHEGQLRYLQDKKEKTRDLGIPLPHPFWLSLKAVVELHIHEMNTLLF